MVGASVALDSQLDRVYEETPLLRTFQPRHGRYECLFTGGAILAQAYRMILHKRWGVKEFFAEVYNSGDYIFEHSVCG